MKKIKFELYVQNSAQYKYILYGWVWSSPVPNPNFWPDKFIDNKSNRLKMVLNLNKNKTTHLPFYT